MPAALSYPGVYIEEIPSGVRTITGVPTSVTAFIGRTQKGPVDEATDITSFADFERIFGGLSLESKMCFAVRDFYLNGGSRAVIVRTIHPSYPRDPVQARAAREKVEKAAKEVADAARKKTNGSDAFDEAKSANDTIQGDAAKSGDEKEAAAKAWDIIKPLKTNAAANSSDTAKNKLVIEAAAAKAEASAKTIRTIAVKDQEKDYPDIAFEAASPGKWAGYLRVALAAAASGTAKDTADKMGVDAKDLCNLTVSDTAPGGASETFLNVTVKESARRIDKVLAAESNLIRWAGASLDSSAPALPSFGEKVTVGGEQIDRVVGDQVTLAQAALDAARRKHSDNPLHQDVIDAQKALKSATDAALASTSDGWDLKAKDFLPPNGDVDQRGLHALEQLYARDGLFNLLCIPPYKADDSVDPGLIAAAAAYCEKRRAMLIVDPPVTWKTVNQASAGFSAEPDQIGTRSKNAAIFFPRIKQPNPLRDDQLEEFAPCGVVAGVFARTDVQRGVWKAPAGIDATLVGVSSLSLRMTDEENGLLNPLGINCLRTFPIYGRTIWGARTLRGADAFADEWKYIPVRRTALFIEESLYRGLKWVVFEPNDEPLWAQIRLNVGAFMHTLFRQGAFQGASPREAYFVKCDATTTTQTHINLGIVNILVGFAPLKPAEFVVIQLQQIAGQIEV